MINSTKKYDDIINLPHHVSIKHKHMSMEMRAAQFAPFAALTGYEDAVKETGRLTSERIELDEEQKVILDEKLKIINDKIIQHPKISLTYFIPDMRKEGGKYETVAKEIKKIDEFKHSIIMMDGEEILINDIVAIESEIFNNDD